MTAPLKPMPYGTDLGRTNPQCPAASHGTYTAYRRGCRCPHARDAHRIYNKRRREGREPARLFDACGVRRRIQALLAIGHTCQTIADAAGYSNPDRVFGLTRRSLVTGPTVDAIKRAYRVLAETPGASRITRERAERRGWVSPMRWGADIDDPDAVPDPVEPDEADPGFVDEAAVEFALTGAKVPLRDAELIAAIHIGVARGLAHEPLASLLHIDFRAVRTIAGGVVPPRFGALVRRRLALVRSAA